MRLFSPALGGLAAAAAFATMIATAPAASAASYPQATFRVPYGQTYTTGVVTFYNRSVLAEGEHKAVAGSGCRNTRVMAMNNTDILGVNEWAQTCSGSQKFSLTIPAHRPGGATKVVVSLMGPGGKELAHAVCYRTSKTCVVGGT